MGQFDNDDEDGADISAIKNPEVRSYLLEKYRKAADDSGVRDAQKSAARTQLIMGIAEGLGDFSSANTVSRGGQGFDPSLLRTLAQQSQSRVGQAEQNRQNRMNQVLTEDKLGHQQTERDRDNKRFEWEGSDQSFKGEERGEKRKGWEHDAKTRPLEIEGKEAGIANTRAGTASTVTGTKVKQLELDDAAAARDPASKISGTARVLMGTRVARLRASAKDDASKSAIEQMVKDVSDPNTSAHDLLETEKLLDKLDKSNGKGFSIQTVEGENGRKSLVGINLGTLEQVPLGLDKAYADVYSSATDSVVNRGTKVGTPAVTPDGQKLSEVRTGLDVARAGGKAGAIQDVKNVQAATEATAKTATREQLTTKWQGLYDQAEKENGVGPAMGRLSGVQNTAGFSAGPATDALITSLQNDANSYIKEVSGATVTDGEQARLDRVRPTAGMTRELFQNRVKEYMAEAEKIAAEKVAIAGKKTTTAPGGLTSAQQSMLDKARAAVADPATDPTVKASAQKVIDKYGK